MGAVCPCIGRTEERDVAVQSSITEVQPSKSEAKRLKKLEKKEMQKGQFGQKKRDKKKEQKQRRQGARHELLAAMSQEERDTFIAKEKAAQQVQQAEEQASLQLAFDSGAPKVVVNCSFADSMDYKELTSLAKQCQLSYTAVRDLRSPVQLHLASLSPDNPGMYALDKVGYQKWLVHTHPESVWDLFEPDQLVVLSPDAEMDLDEVRADRIYVIGGLVDRTIQRNQTKAQAESRGNVTLRKLPIKSLGPPGMFPVLNIDVVVSILHERFIRGPDSSWRDILLHCMPQRQHPGPSRQVLRKERAKMRKEGMTDEQIAAAMGADAGSDNQSEGAASNDSDVSDAEAAEPQVPDLRQGTDIEVVGFGFAKIISLGRVPQGKHQGKYKIRYNDDGSLYHVLPEQFRVVTAEQPAET